MHIYGAAEAGCERLWYAGRRWRRIAAAATELYIVRAGSCRGSAARLAVGKLLGDSFVFAVVTLSG